MTDFEKLNDGKKLELLNQVFAEIAKAPTSVIDAILFSGKSMDLVLGGVASHPSYG